MFIVPTSTPGVNIVRDVPTMEHPYPRFGRFNGHSEIFYEDVRLGHDALLGEEGEGFVIAQHRLVPGRIHHCMRWLGLARRAFDMLCERSLYRPVRGGLLGDRQTVQNWIADSAAEMQAARLMVLHAAWKIDTFGSSAARNDVSMVKFFGAKVLHDVIDRALQLHGGLGFSVRHAARVHVPLRAARAARRRRRRGAPRGRRAPDPQGLPRAGGRRADRVHPEAPRGVGTPVRRDARGGDGERLARAAALSPNPLQCQECPYSLLVYSVFETILDTASVNNETSQRRATGGESVTDPTQAEQQYLDAVREGQQAIVDAVEAVV